jgi:antirestriction protein ArdC
MSKHSQAAPSRASLYEEITNKIIGELEAGRLHWVQPWDTSAAKAPLAMPRNAHTELLRARLLPIDEIANHRVCG